MTHRGVVDASDGHESAPTDTSRLRRAGPPRRVSSPGCAFSSEVRGGVPRRRGMSSPVAVRGRRFEVLRRRFEVLRRRFEVLRRRFEVLRRRFEVLRRRFEVLRRRTDAPTTTLTPDNADWVSRHLRCLGPRSAHPEVPAPTEHEWSTASMRGPRRASARVAQAVPSPHGPSRAGHEGGGNERGPWARPPQGERERQPEISGYPANAEGYRLRSGSPRVLHSWHGRPRPSRLGRRDHVRTFAWPSTGGDACATRGCEPGPNLNEGDTPNNAEPRIAPPGFPKRRDGGGEAESPTA